MLSELQQQIVRVMADLPEAEDFALAGGAALVARGIVERTTEDLDLFATSASCVDALLPALEAALRDADLAVERTREAPGYARLEVSRGDERTVVDIGYDARIREVEATPLGALLSEEELAADKLLALMSRAAPRDFVDVYALAGRVGFARIRELAQEKDLGFDLPMLLHALEALVRLPRQDFPVDDEEFAVLTTEVQEWLADVRGELQTTGDPDEAGESP